MPEKFESRQFVKGLMETEALPKIEKLLGRRGLPFSRWDLIADFPYPKILPEERTVFEEKWRNFDIAASDMDDPKFKEYTEERHQLDEKLQELMKQKSPKEILERAEESFRGHLQMGVMAASVDNLMKAHHQAYEVARLFLTKGLTEEAAQSCFSMLWRRIKEVDINDPRKTQLINGVMSLRRWFPDVSINLARDPEKAGQILSFLLVDGSLNDTAKRELFNMLVATREIKTKSQDEKTKTRKIIVGHTALSEAAKEELQSLINAGKVEQVIMAANFLEERGILDLEKDADFFEAITKKKQ